MAVTTLPLPLVLCRTKLTLTVDPDVKVVVGCPAAFCVCALLDIAAWLTTNPVPPVVIAMIAVPTLLLLSVAVTVTLPERPVGTIM